MKPSQDTWFAIVNPIAGYGRALDDLPTISKLLRDHDVDYELVFTEHKYHATQLTVEAVRRGYRKIIVMGGDGTLHEVVNGIFIQQEVATDQILVAVIAVGTGNDWIRMYGIPRKYSEAINAIVESHSFLQDVGVVKYEEASYRQQRYMSNAGGIGLDATVVQRFNRLKAKGYRGRRLYVYGLVKSFMRYTSTGMRIWVDDQLVVNDIVLSATIGVCKYNGGGMMQVPQAISSWILSHFTNPVILLLVINAFLLIVGMVMDTTPAILILTPILLPIVESIGMDPIHFGVMMVVNLAIGFVTPPIGVNLFVASSLTEVPLMEIAKRAMPMILYFLVALLVITFVPAVSLALL